MEKARFIDRSEVTVLLLTVLLALTESLAIGDNSLGNGTDGRESREEAMIRFRLPNNTIPRLYRINLEPDMAGENMTWNGESGIDFEVLSSTKIVTLHAYENIAIDENFTSLVDWDGNEYRPIEHSRDNEVEFLKIVFDRDIPVGNYSLNLRYHGVDTQQLVGFFWAHQRFTEIPFAATHFEATTARRAFPCWDEPGLKARFRMSIKHDQRYKAISNMPEIERIATEDGKILTSFDTTPVMSIYLLTFVISDYESISNEFGNVTVWGGKSRLEELRHILNTSQKVVDFMEVYTGLKFGVSRIGSVVVPIFVASATEHWGLVTYSSARVSFNSSTDTTMKLDRINLLIAHELSHSWFGNRVSPRWWNDIWLNEAFAAYFQYVIMDEINGNPNDMGLFVVRNNQESSFFHDLRETSTCVRWTPVTNREIRILFGQITYRKGAAIVHMFRNVLTDDVFRAGIQKYLTKHSHKAVEAEDLTTALQEAYDENVNSKAPLNVKEAMMSWLMQTGYPIIDVTRNYITGDTTVTQRSALIEDTSKRWWIPLNYATKTDFNFSSTTPSSWMSDAGDTVTIGGIDKDDWVIFNVQASGYYRVNYDNENWKRIIDYMNTDDYKNIHVLNRAQLINDVHTLAQQEPSRYAKYFWQLTKYLAREVEYIPWRVAKNALESYNDLLSGVNIYHPFQNYKMSLANSLIEKVGYETRPDDHYMTKMAKEDVVAWACVSGHAGCVDFSARRLIQYIDDPINNRLHPDNKVAIFCAGLRGLNGTSAKRVTDWALENDKDVLQQILGCTENHEIQRIFLNSVKKDNNELYLLSLIMKSYNILDSSDENFNFVIDFILETYRELTKYASLLVFRPCHVCRRLFASTIDFVPISSDTFHFDGSLLLTYISPLVRTNARLQKYEEILKHDLIANDKSISGPMLLIKAEQKVAEAERNMAKLQALWDQQLFSDNFINNSTIGSR